MHSFYLKSGVKFMGTNKTKVQDDIRATLPRVYGDMRQGYMAELVGQIVTGLLPDEMSFKQCEWGNEHEDSARALFELELGVDVDVPAFIYKDKGKRCGISPDGLIVGKKIGLELKCPFTTKVFVEFATCEKIKKEYIPEQKAYTSLASNIAANYKEKLSLYLYTSDGLLIELPGSKSKRLKAFGDKSKDIKLFVKENKININKEAGLIEVIKYFDTL